MEPNAHVLLFQVSFGRLFQRITSLFCEVWVEGTAGRGSQEVGSALKKYILENCLNIEELILWSDSCGGQNRNIKIVLMMKHVLHSHPTLKKITMRLLIPGHTFLPNDSEFGDVESHLKSHQRLYTDDDYINVMKTCRKKSPFTVTKLVKEDFKSVVELESNIVNRKLDIEGNKVNWLKFREMGFEKDKPFALFFKTELNQDPREIDLSKRKVGRQFSPFQLDLPLLQPEGKAISVPKMKDLKSMLVFIPSDAKDFYKKFFCNPNVDDDVEGFNTALDFDLE